MALPIVAKEPKNRTEVFRFFDGVTPEFKGVKTRERYRPPFVKSFLIEHVSSKNGHTPQPPNEILKKIDVKSRQIDDGFWEIIDKVKNGDTKIHQSPVGYAEKYDERFFAYYTAEGSDEARRRVNRWIRSLPDLDFSWFSSQMIQMLWEKDVSLRDDNQFGRLSFYYEGLYDYIEDSHQNQDIDGEDEFIANDWLDEDRIERSYRKARFTMSDRLGLMRDALVNLQESYSPLHALYSIRLPSDTSRGGNDLYQDGRITSKSVSFMEHRNAVRYIYRTYKGALERTEEIAWCTNKERFIVKGAHQTLSGVPLIVEFKDILSQDTFERWMDRAFRKDSAFRLWGNPIRLGPTKVHVYGADRHLWQPIHLEITNKRVVAIIPKGTCGNTFHRLITNIQRYVSPSIDAWIGNMPFREILIP